MDGLLQCRSHLVPLRWLQSRRRPANPASRCRRRPTRCCLRTRWAACRRTPWGDSLGFRAWGSAMGSSRSTATRRCLCRSSHSIWEVRHEIPQFLTENIESIVACAPSRPELRGTSVCHFAFSPYHVFRLQGWWHFLMNVLASSMPSPADVKCKHMPHLLHD